MGHTIAMHYISSITEDLSAVTLNDGQGHSNDIRLLSLMVTISK